MNCSEAKYPMILDYLEQNGHKPENVKYGKAWFKSPLRKEKTASFKVDLSKNLWYDFGSGEGGDLVYLVMKLNNVNIKEAVEIIGKNSNSTNGITSVFRDRKHVDELGCLRINRLQTLNNHALINYLTSRNVSLTFAQTYLKEAYYSVHGKKCFALAFENDKSGHELRNKYCKLGSSPKYFTTIPVQNSQKINVFEGFMDFLSCCTYYKRFPKSTTIVLNSLSFLPKIGTILNEAKEINLFLDNDHAGREATRKILALHDTVFDWSPVIYPKYKDFNDFLMGNRMLEY